VLASVAPHARHADSGVGTAKRNGRCLRGAVTETLASGAAHVASDDAACTAGLASA
jgi:hypothetical protein